VLQSLADAGRGTSTLARCKSIVARVTWYAANGPKSQKVTVPQDARTAGKDAKMPQNASEPRIRKALSEAEVALMVAKLEGHAYQPIVALIAASGLRPSEALGLEHGDFDSATAMLTIARTVIERDGRWIVGPVKSKAAAREIPLSTKAAAVLKAQLAAHPGLPTAPIFPGRRGETWLSVRYFSHDVARHTGRQVYDLRHTLASRLNDQGWPIAKAAAYLGHIPETYIRVYLHSMPADNATALEDVRAALG
jgi:integrase